MSTQAKTELRLSTEDRLLRDGLQLIDPRFYASQVRDVFAFLVRPRAEIETVSWRSAIAALVALFVAGEVLSVLAVLPMALLEEFDLMVDLENALSHGEIGQWSRGHKLLIAGLFAPLLDELAFRLPLRLRTATLAVSAGTLAYFVVSGFLSDTLTHNLTDHVAARVGAGIVTALGAYALLRSPGVPRVLGRLYSARFPLVYWLSVLAFGLGHLPRYTNLSLDHLPFVPIIVLPQLVSASIFGYVRMRYGFVVAVVMHMVANGYLILIFG